MKSRIRKIGSAHVIALIALVMAVTGTSVALPGKNSVDGGDIKNKTITSADIKTNSLGANQINESKLGPVNQAVEAQNVLWATVKDPNGAGNAMLTHSGQPSTTVVEGNGVASVTFGRDVTQCSAVASAVGADYASTVLSGGNVVQVRTRDANGNPEDQGFSLQVVC